MMFDKDGKRAVARSQGLGTVTVDNFAVQAKVPAQLAYRIYQDPSGAKAQITGGPGPFQCAGYGLSQASVAGGDDATLQYTCVVPAGTAVVEGLPAVLALRTGQVKGVLSLPVTAVAGQADTGDVVLEDGTTQTVQLGLSDGSYIEVKGLTEGQTVRTPAPDLRPADGS